MLTPHRLWPRFVASLILHGVMLCGAVLLWTHHAVSAVPVFQGGEFSLELADVLPVGPDVAVAAQPAPDPKQIDIEEEDEEEIPEEPPETVDVPPVEEEDEMQIVPEPFPAPAPPPTPTPPPAPQAPPTPVPAPKAPKPVSGSAVRSNTNQTRVASAPGSGSANSGVPGAPRLASSIHPVYPPGARLRGEEGKVMVRADVKASGKAQTAEVVRSSGYPALDQAAMNAVLHARFIPARKGWTLVESQTELTFRFALVD